MKKEIYLEILRSNNHADELIRYGFISGVLRLAIADTDIDSDDFDEIMSASKEGEE